MAGFWSSILSPKIEWLSTTQGSKYTVTIVANATEKLTLAPRNHMGSDTFNTNFATGNENVISSSGTTLVRENDMAYLNFSRWY
jgi:hypothetical protein